MNTQATSAYGSQVLIGNGASPEVFTPIAEVRDISGPAETADTVEVTPHGTAPGPGYKERIGTLLDLGQVTFDVNWIGNDTSHTRLVTVLRSGLPASFQVLDPDGAGVQFAAFVTNIGRTLPVAGARVRSITLQPTGDPTDVAGS